MSPPGHRVFVPAYHPLGPQAGHRGLTRDRTPNPAPPAPLEHPQSHRGAAAALWVWEHRVQLCPRVTLHTPSLSFPFHNCALGGNQRCWCHPIWGSCTPDPPFICAHCGEGWGRTPSGAVGARRVLGGSGFGVVLGRFSAGSSPGSAPGSWLGQQFPLPDLSSLPGNGKNRVNKAFLSPGGAPHGRWGHPKTGGDTPWCPGTAEWGRAVLGCRETPGSAGVLGCRVWGYRDTPGGAGVQDWGEQECRDSWMCGI